MKGIVIFLVILAVSIIFCGVVPFMLMPDAGIAMALPVIAVPGEVLWEDFLGVSGLTITNTLVGTLLADVLVLLFAFSATRNLKTVPGRLQGLFEVLTDALYGVAKSSAGANARKVFSLMATIVLFVLFANWLKLLPGVDSIGLMHCAHGGVNGYPRNGILLEVNKALDSGTRATEADYEACYAKEHGKAHAEDAAHTEGEAATHAEGEAAPAEGEAVAAAAETAAPAEGATAEAPAVRDDIYAVTPFVRAAATDLNMTLALAVLAVVAVQVLGVRAQGVRYFAKFINTPALENAGKRPMGLMDFAVGFLEIISEFSRIISFGFRLFGNIFAGQVLLFVIPFLAGALVPLAVYGFELFVGAIQAFVFGMLTLVFAAMAMAGHDHDEHHAE